MNYTRTESVSIERPIRLAAHGKACSVYLLLLSNKSIALNPKKNTFYLLPGNEHIKLKSILSQSYQSQNDLLLELTNKFKFLENAEGISVIHSKHNETGGSELTIFNDRFHAFLNQEKFKEQLYLSLPIAILATVAMCTGRLLLSLGLFHRFISTDRTKVRKAPSTFNATVGHNALIASKFLPFGFDCKLLAYTYKYIYNFFGYQCDIAIGIVEDPFVAHMWAMSDGIPNGELTNILDEYHPIYHSSW